MLNGKALKHRRQALKISQRALAKLADLAPETLSRFENGKENLSSTTKLALIKLLEERECE